MPSKLIKIISKCDTLPAAFEKLRKKGVPIWTMNTLNGQDSRKILLVKSEHIVLQGESGGDREIIHPYGSSIEYTPNFQN
ncbi:hypothetical protein J4225_03535 [Candidatus Pacearchaeota archaeon]|nr:hypothetical protein [Candidatus Pacearchaeota archaeon]